MTYLQIVIFLLHFIIFMLGAGIGSFLNVVIYRLPLEISVNNPKRSFCPICKKQIPWYRNLPLFTWLLQRGRCAECKAPIPFRYFFVELLTGVLFYAVFLHYRGSWDHPAEWAAIVLLYWIFTALLIAGTFIDIDHYILPHEITFGGLAVGLIGSFAVPELMGETERGRAILISFTSACIGLISLWIVVELGKLAFGRLRKRFEKPEPWSISQPVETEPPIFKFGKGEEEEELSYLDIFGRKTDRLIIKGNVTLQDHTFKNAITEIKMETIKVKLVSGKEETFKTEDVSGLSGTTTEIIIPREAMGLGDIYLLAMIGSFLGWKAIFFTIVASSMLGCIIGVIPRIFGKTEWNKQIPFGPYLAGGAMIWLFYGPQIVEWYLGRLAWRQEW